MTMIYENFQNISSFCSFNTANSAVNLVLAILYIATGSIVVLANILCLIFYLKYKKRKDWKWNDVDLVLILFYDLICGLISYFTAVALCIDLKKFNPVSCIVKYCIMFFICMELSKMSLINGCERLFSIKFNNHNMKRFQQKHSRIISIFKPVFRIGS
jgi:flagellar biosynthesis protein FlhB